uniref:Uncharacterized protein n=1 Tax=Lygus hesperus TaxID=30085 RepID=A0A0A9XWC5_LYGHE
MLLQESVLKKVVHNRWNRVSQSPPPESSIPSAERSVDTAVASGSSTTAETITVSTEEIPKLLTTTERASEASNATEAVVTETSREPSNATVTVPEITTESGARIVGNESTTAFAEESTRGTDIIQKESTSESTTEVALVHTTSKQRIIETTDVETVRKDCKFWVLISSSEDTELDEKYEQCYEKLTTIMSNYKNVYKFGAVHTGEFFINLYLKNKSNPITILSDYSCDEEKLKTALDAYKTETPGEFCQDPEDRLNSTARTSSEPVTLSTLMMRPTSTVAPDCALQLVVRYPRKESPTCHHGEC